MKILITGGAGYIGQSLITKLFEHVPNIDEILIYDNLSQTNYNLFFDKNFKDKPVRLIHGELLDSRKLKDSIKGIDVVYHLAARVTTPFSDLDSHYFEQVNHWGTAELVNAVEESGVKHFINLSSVSIYGNIEEYIEETTVPNPVSFYGISKLRAERHVHRLMGKKEKVHIIRAGNVYGYNSSMRMDAVINRFMFESNFKNRISIHGNGEQKRAFIHVEKLAETMARLITENVPNDVYNIAEHNFSVNDLSDSLKVFYPSLETLYINQHIRMVEIKVKTPNKIADFIQYQPKDFLEELKEFKEHFAF